MVDTRPPVDATHVSLESPKTFIGYGKTLTVYR